MTKDQYICEGRYGTFWVYVKDGKQRFMVQYLRKELGSATEEQRIKLLF